MNRSSDPNRRDDDSETPATTDPAGVAVQEQVRADHDALQEQAARVAATVPASVRNTPIQSSDVAAEAIQEQVKADRDALQDQADRIAATVPASVRNTPIERAVSPVEDTEARRNGDAAHANAEAAREGARRVQASTNDRDRR